MDNSRQIMKTLTLYIPGDACNMRCEYCYITECFKDGRNTTPAVFVASVDEMIYAFRPERIGGLAHIIVIGKGETLIPPETVPLCKGLLKQGHIVEVVTNGVLSNRIDELLDCDEDCLSRLIIKCSLHWNELKRLNLVDTYFNNIKKALSKGASSYPFLVVGTSYINCLDEIREACLENLGGLPHCTPCVIADSSEQMLDGNRYATDPPCTKEFVASIKEKFGSSLFEQSVRFLDVDVKKVFCYAGKWSFGVDLCNGEILKCHNICTGISFFENLDEKMPEIEPVCNSCGLASCALQYDMFSMGLIPEVPDVPTYSEMMCNNSFFTDTVREMMDFKLYDRHPFMNKMEEREFLFGKITTLSKENRLFEENIKSRVIAENPVNKVLDVIDSECADINLISKVKYKDIAAFIEGMHMSGATEENTVSVLGQFVEKLLFTQKYMNINYVFDEPFEIRELSASMLACRTTDIDRVEQAIDNHETLVLAALIYFYSLECVK